MSRDLTAGVITQLQAESVEIGLLFEGEFASGWVRIWSGLGNLSWNGYTWTGAGTLLGISSIDETNEVRAVGATVSVSGIPSDLVSLALGDARSGKTGRVYLAFFSSGSIVSDPILQFEGRLDVPVIEDGGETATIAISYESKLIELERPRERRYTPEDQAIDYPGDLGFDYVAALQDAQITWGR